MKIQVYSTPMCTTCPAAKQVVKEVLKKHPDVDYEEVDTLERQEEAFSCGVVSVPAIVIDGELWKCGVPSKKEIESEILRRKGK